MDAIYFVLFSVMWVPTLICGVWTLRHAARRNRRFLWFSGMITIALQPVISLFAWLSAPPPGVMWNSLGLASGTIPTGDEHYIQWLFAAFAISLFWLIFLGAIYSDQNARDTKRKV
jgi:hypothetical protein